MNELAFLRMNDGLEGLQAGEAYLVGRLCTTSSLHTGSAPRFAAPAGTDDAPAVVTLPAHLLDAEVQLQPASRRSSRLGNWQLAAYAAAALKYAASVA